MIKKAILIIIALVILAGAGYLVYQRFFNPQHIFERMVQEMRQIENVSIDVLFEISSNNIDEQTATSFVYPDQYDQLHDSVRVLFDQVLQLDDLEDKVEVIGRGVPELINGQVMSSLTLVAPAETISGFSSVAGQVWVGKKDHLLHQARFISVSEQAGQVWEVEISIVFSDHNQAVVAEQVEDSSLPASESVDLDSLPVASDPEEEVQDSESTGPVDSDNDGIYDADEGFYGSDPNNPDTDGDGYLDGDEIENGYNPTGPGTLFNFGLPEL